MTPFSLTLIIDLAAVRGGDLDGDALLDEYEDRIFEAFDGAASPATGDGRARIGVTTEAPDLAAAVRWALGRTDALGVPVAVVEAPAAAFRAAA